LKPATRVMPRSAEGNGRGLRDRSPKGEAFMRGTAPVSRLWNAPTGQLRQGWTLTRRALYRRKFTLCD
jgi:hypothetical protein